MKESGNYIAVKVPENTWDYYYSESKRKLYYDQHSMVMGFVDLKDLIKPGTSIKILGLLSELKLEIEKWRACDLQIPQEEWNQWLILEKSTQDHGCPFDEPIFNPDRPKPLDYEELGRRFDEQLAKETRWSLTAWILKDRIKSFYYRIVKSKS